MSVYMAIIELLERDNGEDVYNLQFIVSYLFVMNQKI
jgi:hypothetical protein